MTFRPFNRPRPSKAERKEQREKNRAAKFLAIRTARRYQPEGW